MTKYRAAWLALSVFGALALTRPLNAQGGPTGCIEDLAIPGFGGFLKVPAVVEIDLTIGSDGKAKDARIATSDDMMSTYLRAYFVGESRYSKSCQGQKLHFTVRYVVQGVPTGEPRYETRWRSPGELILTCHPVKPTIN
jgi:hypothetical protein